ncbi:MAG: DUF2269 family protein [Gemmatimonadota bacterium]
MPTTDSYLFFKALHVIGTVLLVGNVTVTGFWAAYMFRFRRRNVAFRPIARAILWTDLVFTLGGATLLSVTGVLMARQAHLPILGTPWIRHAPIALSVSGLLWLTILLPDQLRMERSDPNNDRLIRGLFVRWSVVGWIAAALLYYGVWVMVTRTG